LKLDNKWVGLFKVQEKVGQRAYRLKMLKNWKGHLVFHKEKLKSYHEPRFDNQEKLGGTKPELVSDPGKEYEVEAILT
jgi:hypothetical protein